MDILQYKTQLYGYAYKLCNNKEDAEDLVSQVFMYFIKNKDKIKNINMSNYLYTAIYYKFIALKRSEKRRAKTEKEFIMQEQPTPIDIYSGKMILDKLSNTVLSLTKKEQMIYNMRFINEASYKDIAKTLNIAEGTVKSKISRIKEKIKDRYQQ